MKKFHAIYPYAALFLALFIWRLGVWVLWQFGLNLDFDIMLFHFLAPWDGVYSGFFTNIIDGCIIPPAIITLSVFLLTYVFSSKKYLRYYWCVATVLLLGSFVYLYNALGVHAYLFAKPPTTFYEEHYIGARDLTYTYPQQSKNLLFVFMESLESTYMERKIFGENLLPQISALAAKNVAIKGYEKVYNTHWTFAALVNVLCGLPVQTESTSYANAASLADVLKPAGYTMAALYGGKRHFAWTDVFLQAHTFDYIWAQEDLEAQYDNLSIKDWGLADSSLYQVVQDKLSFLHQSGKPFALFVNTIDTHVPGYLDPGCPVIHGDMRDIITCADTMFSHFMSWAQSQPWYKNTVIIIVGDHLAMQNRLSDKYLLRNDIKREIVNIFINSYFKRSRQRSYAMFDMMPTVVEAMGITLPGHRLGMGVSLFSPEPTLLERYGQEKLNQFLRGRSHLYDSFSR